ncbi:LysR family transcriptional regulator [Robbsia sp. KACC 23696]|uniref:LysR family transcriptional regulator n=1 Tax=Robbsia sp. KACC 23696 TaxID=3149231 RepID=UPI00325B4F69
MNNLDWKIVSELHATPNISKTALRLNMTQSALSKRLQQIESEMDVQIVLRFSKGVVFTPEGEYLAEKARAFLAEFDDIKKTILQVGSGRSGQLRIGATNGFARSTLLLYLKKFQQAFPGVELSVSADISANLIASLKDYTAHVGFICGETDVEFERVLISQDQARAVSSTPITLADLPTLPQIVYRRDPFANKLVDAWWRDRFKEPAIIGMRANHGDTCREMVAAGLGYGIFLSNVFLPEDHGLYELALTYADDTPLIRNSWMVWQKDMRAIPLVRNFVDFMQEQLEADASPVDARTLETAPHHR